LGGWPAEGPSETLETIGMPAHGFDPRKEPKGPGRNGPRNRRDACPGKVTETFKTSKKHSAGPLPSAKIGNNYCGLQQSVEKAGWGSRQHMAYMGTRKCHTRRRRGLTEEKLFWEEDSRGVDWEGIRREWTSETLGNILRTTGKIRWCTESQINRGKSSGK